MRLNLRFVWAFAKFNGISWIRRSPANILSPVVTSLCLLFIIYFLSGGRLADYAVVGGVIAIMASTSMMNTGQTAMMRLEYRIHDLIVATKATALEYVVALSTSDLVFSVPGIAIFTLLSLIFGLFTLQRFAATVAVLLLLALGTTSIAFSFGSRIRRTIGMWAISGILSALLTLLSPTFYPYTALPQPILYVLALSPVTPAAVVLQGVYGLAPMNYPMVLLLVAEVAAYTMIAMRFARWAEH